MLVAVAVLLVSGTYYFGLVSAQERARTSRTSLPAGFIYLAEREPSIVIDLRYAGRDNFTGGPVNGYERGRCIVSKAAGDALSAVQADLRRYGFGLKVFDAYRPQRAVNHFIRWTKSPRNDPELKTRYYPDVVKGDLVKQGYIAAKSGHSRGSCVDVTLVTLPGAGGSPKYGASSRELDMGTPFDFFGRRSHSEFRNLSTQQRLHRLLLRTMMERHGFEYLPEEWWHFSLKDEPFPDTYFDFPVR